MFTEVLPGNTKAILALLAKSDIIKRAYLAGGTALALQIGHRISYDLDFFTKSAFDENALLPVIGKIGKFKLENIAWRTIIGKFKDVKFSIFYYKYPILYPTKKFEGINLINVRDIAAMKLAAMASRGVKRDFIDLYFICKEHLSLEKILKLYEAKYKNLATTSVHILKSLTYFDDAEGHDMPHMLKEVKWEEVKRYFESEVKRLSL